MAEGSSRLKALKEHFEPFVWFASVLGSVVGGILVVWRVIVSPTIDGYAESFKKSISDRLDEQIIEIRESNKKKEEIVNAALDQIRKKISDELDSTYYMAKTFTIKSGAVNQDPLSQFFYVAQHDVVLLFIWSSSPSGVSTKMEISINDGQPKTLKDFSNGKLTSWNNVDITEEVRKASSLDVEQFPGIGENVYNIKITPIPRLANTQQKQKPNEPLALSPLKGSFRREESRGDPEIQVDVYALVIVRRSPFK